MAANARFVLVDVETNGLRIPTGWAWSSDGWTWDDERSRRVSEVVELAARVWDPVQCPYCRSGWTPADEKDESNGPSTWFVCQMRTDWMDEGARAKHGRSALDTQTGQEPAAAWAAFGQWLQAWSAAGDGRPLVLVAYCARLLDLPMLVYHAAQHGVVYPDGTRLMDAREFSGAFARRGRAVSLQRAVHQHTPHADALDTVAWHQAAADVEAMAALLHHTWNYTMGCAYDGWSLQARGERDEPLREEGVYCLGCPHPSVGDR